MVIGQQEKEKWMREDPLIKKVVDLEPVVWLNPKRKFMYEANLQLSRTDMEEAEALWQRFAPYLAKEFPATQEMGGIVESPFRPIDNMKKALNGYYQIPLEGKLFLKCDNELAIAGSIKARGGVYEVLYHAEQLALQAGLISKTGNYELFASDKFKSFFSRYAIGVGSTGNLGLSIGIISAKLGFDVSVYMSADAKPWKKDLLREKGATVHEIAGDFGEAIKNGRNQTQANPNSYFIDDEKSKELFLGYSTAAFRLQKQLEEQKIVVDQDHPLFIYLPCGVGGAPGGIAFGVKQLFGDHVHCFFVEPTHSPAVLLGLMTGLKEKVCVQDFGIDNCTEGDGLAVGRPSSFASAISEQLVSGVYTLEDDELFKLLAFLADSEKIHVEPSAAAGLSGPQKILQSGYYKANGIDAENAVHIVWATGGSLVPKEDMKKFYDKGKALIE
ncbi:D-serine ammonia-lyase [Planomicrobium sp. CPCC 101079]|uniref:D-serine ammonia-lyase n=1 Tax=Planomicrobium sp. CPCC 101079 TaxID=2599618 RepID=UPI0011B4E833|nr:D-serine ammonia-lyase [Planomicrobium sp. CPCC 101079]TWT04689.1 D-serine ammonia-lyase [Planomicrobium sp. CPCC 101079]